jgi:lactoylglutathione lyase
MLVCVIQDLQTVTTRLNCYTGMATLTTSKGLLELYHIPADSSTPYSNGNDYSPGGVGFGHIGFTVPDVVEALARVKEFGYEIIKPLDEAKEEQMGMPPAAIAGEFGEVAEGYKHLLRQLAFVKDPDVSGPNIRMHRVVLTVSQGYWVELVPHIVKNPGSQ